MDRHPGAVPAPRSVRAVGFDTDGVVTDSAGAHAAAWKGAFDACPVPAGLSPFDPVDEYRRSVDGRSRRDGAAAFREPLPPGGGEG